LVYLDSLILEDGQSAFDAMPADVTAARRKQAAEQGGGIAIPVPPITAFGIPDDHPSAGWVRRHLTPHPIRTYEDPLRLKHPVGNGRPRTYIVCTQPSHGPLRYVQEAIMRQPGWIWHKMATGHDAMVLAPELLTQILAAIE
jgi:hypothetical protein